MGLFATRAAVGIGTAAFTAAAASLVADYFPGRRRAVAMGIFAAGIPVGGILGITLGGQLETFYGWRISMMAVAVPGLLIAALVARLTDPNRPPPTLTVRQYGRQLELGATGAFMVAWPLLLGSVCGLLAAWILDSRYGATSSLDTAAHAAGIGLGLAGNLVLVVRANRRKEMIFDFLPAESMNDALGEMRLAVDTVFRTPTLKFLFVGGALVAFGMNGLVGWAPTFMARTHGMSLAEGTLLLGKWGLLAGTAGTLAGGFLPDWLGRYTGRSRMIVSTLGLLLGSVCGLLAAWPSGPAVRTLSYDQEKSIGFRVTQPGRASDAVSKIKAAHFIGYPRVVVSRPPGSRHPGRLWISSRGGRRCSSPSPVGTRGPGPVL